MLQKLKLSGVVWLTVVTVRLLSVLYLRWVHRYLLTYLCGLHHIGLSYYKKSEFFLFFKPVHDVVSTRNFCDTIHFIRSVFSLL